MGSDRHALAVEDLEHDLRRNGIEATICELNATTATATVVAESYLDFILAKAELKLKGLTAVQPG